MVWTVRFLAILAAALALVPPGAHLAALPNKVGMSGADYLVAQGIYRGWAVLGALWVVALAADGALAAAVRGQRWPFRLAVLAGACHALMFAIFFTWTFPANRATANWTVLPEGWEALRRAWEVSHAVNAGVALLGLGCVTASALAWRG